MSTRLRTVSGILLIIAGVLLASAQTDRLFGDLQPTGGRANTQVLEAGVRYAQLVPLNQNIIASVGIHFRKLRDDLPATPIEISLVQNEEIKSTATIAPVFIDNQGATQVRFAEPVKVRKEDPLEIVVEVPSEQSRKIGWQLRNETEDEERIGLSINGVVSDERPGAYQIYTKERPAVAIQFGGLLIMAALYLLIPQAFKRNERVQISLLALGLSVLYATPFWLAGNPSLLFIITTAVLFIVAYLLLRKLSLSPISALFGSIIVTFNSWLPLHFCCTTSVDVFTMGFHDVFLDPNQIASSHPSGAYIGFSALGFAIIGSLSLLAKQKWVRLLTPLVIGGAAFVLVHLVPNLSHLTIATAASFAFLAAHGIERLRSYLGKNDSFVFSVIIAIFLLTLFDLWNVAAISMTYGAE